MKDLEILDADGDSIEISGSLSLGRAEVAISSAYDGVVSLTPAQLRLVWEHIGGLLGEDVGKRGEMGIDPHIE